MKPLITALAPILFNSAGAAFFSAIRPRVDQPIGTSQGRLAGWGDDHA
jgi:hypothetical protein